jgi:hypothetical protein
MARVAKGGGRQSIVAGQGRLLVSVCLVGVFAWFLLSTLERESERAERVSLKVAVSQLRAALVIKGAEVHLSRHEQYEDWAGSNPMLLLQQPLPGYQGLCEEKDPPVGAWCFEEGSQKDGRGVLRYRPGQPITMEGQTGTRKQALAWSVAVEYNDRNGNGRLDEKDLETGLKLVPATKRNRMTVDLNTGVPEE